MASAGAVYVAIKGDMRDFERALNNALRQTNKSAKSMETSMSRVATTVKMLSSAVIALGGAWALREVVRVADTYTLLDSKLKLVSKDTAEFTKIYNELYKISKDTGSNFANNAASYASLAMALKDTDVASDELLKVFADINKSLVVAGASTQEASSFMLQFKQALGANRLAGDEFKAMLEANSYWALQLAKALGTDIKGLYEMKEAGELTTRVVLDAHKKMSESISKDYAGIAMTTGRAMTVLQNSWNELIADTNRATGGTSKLADSIVRLAETVDANRDDITELFAGIIDSIPDVASGIAEITTLTGDFIKTVNGIVDVSEGFGGPGALEMGIIGALLIGGKGKAGVVVLTLTTLNEALEAFNLNIGNLKSSYESIGGPVQNLIDVFTGKRDWNTGAWSDQKEQLDGLVQSFDDFTAGMGEAEKQSKETGKAVKELTNKDLKGIDKALDDFFFSIEKASDKTSESLKKARDTTLAWYAVVGEQLPKDSWLIQAEDAADVAARAYEDIEDKTDKTTSFLEERWTSAWDSVQDELADFLMDFEFSMDSILNIFKRTAAEIAAVGIMGGLKSWLTGGSFVGGVYDAVMGGGGGGGGGSSGGAGSALTIAGMGKKAYSYIAGKMGASGGSGAASGGAGVAGAGASVYGYGTGAGSLGYTGAGGYVGGSVAEGGALAAGSKGVAGGSAAGSSAMLAGGVYAAAVLIGLKVAKGFIDGPSTKIHTLLNRDLSGKGMDAGLMFGAFGQGLSEISDPLKEMLPTLGEYNQAAADMNTGIVTLTRAAGENGEQMTVTALRLDETTGRFHGLGGTMTTVERAIESTGQQTGALTSAFIENIAATYSLESSTQALVEKYLGAGAAADYAAQGATQVQYSVQSLGGALGQFASDAVAYGDTLRHVGLAVRGAAARSLSSGRPEGSFAVGTDYVPRDMIAQIHRGEAIIPAKDNSGSRGVPDRAIVINIGGQQTAIDLSVVDGHITARERRGVTGQRVAYS